MSRPYKKLPMHSRKFSAHANQNSRAHPYLRQEQFADRTFLRVRRQVALIIMPHAERASRAQLRRLVEIYDELLR